MRIIVRTRYIAVMCSGLLVSAAEAEGEVAVLPELALSPAVLLLLPASWAPVQPRRTRRQAPAWPVPVDEPR